MGLHEVVASLTDNWAGTAPYLRPDDVQQIARLAVELSAAAGDDRAARAAGNDLAELLVLRLPARHPVTAVIAGEPRLIASPEEWPRIAAALLALPGVASMIRADDEVTRRLGSVPALTADEVIDNGDDLIRLPAMSPGGQALLPAFQFGPDGRPVPLVARINRLLDAIDDPWGVADWWLGRNAWLNAVPADLIGSGQDDALMGAARAELGEG